MNQQQVKVAIRNDIINKANKDEVKKLGKGWRNIDISIKDLIEHIKQGHPVTHQFSSGKKSKAHFLRANILIADIDKGLSLSDALSHPFVSDHATFLYTTPSHTDENNRFRIIFVLDKVIHDANTYEAMYRSLMQIIPTDPATKSVAQGFYGCDHADVHFIGKSLPDTQIKKMVNEGMKIDQKKSNPSPPTEILNIDTNVKTRSGAIAPISLLSENESIYCPFGTHLDKNPSAFIKVNKQGIKGIHCRSCGTSAWTDSLTFAKDHFNYFDELVTKHAGKENSHFDYQGLTSLFHDYETNIAKSNFHVRDEQYFEINKLVAGVHLMKSPKGTGKTHALAELTTLIKDPRFRKKHDLADDDRMILVGHRQSLISESAEKLGLECYLDTADYDTQTVGDFPKLVSQKPLNYAICLDSLHSRIKHRTEKYGVIIIDESEQVFSHFLSRQMKQPTHNFASLSRLVKQAKFVFCLDADLNKITVAGVMASLIYEDFKASNYQQTHNFHCHLNTYKADKKEIEVYESKNHLQDQLRLSIQRDEKCFVTSNSKKLVEGLYESFSDVFSDKKFILITSDTGSDEDIRSFLKNIKTEILDYDAVFSSPSIGTGIDITFPDNKQLIDVVYGFFDTQINTHFDIDQQLARVRHPKAVRVWISPSKHRMKLSPDVIQQELLFGDKVPGLQYMLDHDGAHANKNSHPFAGLLTTVISEQRRSMNNLKINFTGHKLKNNFDVIEVEKDQGMAGNGSVVGKASRAAQKKAKIASLLNAKVLSDKQQKQIEEDKLKNKPIPIPDRRAYERYWLEKFYKQPITEQLIEFDDNEKMRERIVLFEMVIDHNLALTKYTDIVDKFVSVIEYRDGRVDLVQFKKVLFLRELFSSAGIYDFNTFSFDLKAQYNKQSLAKFVTFAKDHSERYAQLFNKELNSHIDERSPFQLNTFLKLVGLKHQTLKRNRGANSGPATYCIDNERYKQILGISHQRKNKNNKGDKSKTK